MKIIRAVLAILVTAPVLALTINGVWLVDAASSGVLHLLILIAFLVFWVGKINTILNSGIPAYWDISVVGVLLVGLCIDLFVLAPGIAAVGKF